jgi:hypothetical protein
MQPVIEAGDSFTYSAPITLCSFKVRQLPATHTLPPLCAAT